MTYETSDRPTVAETYAGAIGSGSTHTDSHRTKPADLVAAAGMSPYRMGTALMRLVSEWHGGATPPKATPLTERELRKQGMDADLVQAEARRLAAQCADWSLHENKRRFQRLKTLPMIREALQQWVLQRGWVEQGYLYVEQLVADTIRQFLAPACSACEGRKRKVVQSRAVGPECRRCRGTGESDLQHGGRGRALLAYMRTCANQAAADMLDGTHKLRHDLKHGFDRYNQRVRERTEVLRRSDAEERTDLSDDKATAEHFRSTFGARRPPNA